MEGVPPLKVTGLVSLVASGAFARLLPAVAIIPCRDILSIAKILNLFRYRREIEVLRVATPHFLITLPYFKSLWLS